MPYIKTQDDQQLYIRDIGPKSEQNQPPIILLHGFGMHSAHWLPFILPMARKQRFIIPDLRGFGRSHEIDHNRDCVISNYADDLHDIIQALDIPRFKLAGISMGAFVSLQYQGNYGDQLVDRYLHIDQSPKCINTDGWKWGLFGDENQSRLAQAKTLIEELRPYLEKKSDYHEVPKILRDSIWENLSKFFADALSKPSHKRLARKVCSHEILARQIMPVENWSAYISCLKAYIEQDYDMLSILPRLQSPLTLMVGLKSEMYPSGGQLRIADHHKDCEVVTFKNSGHTPLIDQPFAFYQALKRFALA